MAKIKTSIMLSPKAKQLLVKLAEKLGLSQSAIFELAIRHFAQVQDVEIEDD